MLNALDVLYSVYLSQATEGQTDRLLWTLFTDVATEPKSGMKPRAAGGERQGQDLAQAVRLWCS